MSFKSKLFFLMLEQFAFIKDKVDFMFLFAGVGMGVEFKPELRALWLPGLTLLGFVSVVWLF